MITYEWSIYKLITETQGDRVNVVKQVVFVARAKDDVDGVRSEYDGNVYLNDPGTDFTAYDDLTEDQVWSWVFAQNSQANIERDLDAMIVRQRSIQAEKLNQHKTMPWAS